MSKPMIVIDRLVKTYGVNPVLRGVSLEIPAGEFVTLVGPNGAGKTTILRILATLLAPTAGSVAVGGWALPGNAQKVRPYIGLVSHQSLLYGDLTAAENLTFFARLYGGEIEEGAIEAALRRVGLAARARDSVGTFSRGMVQRLTIARATLHRPDILLLDEPYTGLDQDAASILDELLEEERAAGRTILMITHNLLRAANLSDRVVILSQGKIQHDLRTDTLDTAEFLELYAMATRRRRKNRQHES